MNIQTLTSNVRSPVRRKTVSPFDPTDLGASQDEEPDERVRGILVA